MDLYVGLNTCQKYKGVEQDKSFDKYMKAQW